MFLFLGISVDFGFFSCSLSGCIPNSFKTGLLQYKPFGLSTKHQSSDQRSEIAAAQGEALV
jgi:hypothetical protein